MKLLMPQAKNWRRTLGWSAVLFVVLVIGSGLGYAAAFGPTDQKATIEQLIVQPDESVSDVADALVAKGFVRNQVIFMLAYWGSDNSKGIRPGGYDISKSMDAWSIANALVEAPFYAWVTIPVGERKEQIADQLAKALAWTPDQKDEFLTVDTAGSPNYVEGVYLPGTYLLQSNSTPAQVTALLRAHFQAAFAPFADEAVKKNIPWTKVLTIASLIEREAGSKSDMNIISGVIWKRLAVGMPLAIDATLQYQTGTEENWWPHPKAVATYADTPFNTYKHAGLPPHPIDNPGPAAIEAALNPAVGNCLFYLHDDNGQIHCSATYKGQQQNVSKYLK